MTAILGHISSRFDLQDGPQFLLASSICVSTPCMVAIGSVGDRRCAALLCRRCLSTKAVHAAVRSTSYRGRCWTSVQWITRVPRGTGRRKLIQFGRPLRLDYCFRCSEGLSAIKSAMRTHVVLHGSCCSNRTGRLVCCTFLVPRSRTREWMDIF